MWQPKLPNKAFVYLLQKPQTQGKHKKFPSLTFWKSLSFSKEAEVKVVLRAPQEWKSWSWALHSGIYLTGLSNHSSHTPAILSILIQIVKICRKTDNHQNATYTKREVQKLHGSLQGAKKQRESERNGVNPGVLLLQPSTPVCQGTQNWDCRYSAIQQGRNCSAFLNAPREKWDERCDADSYRKMKPLKQNLLWFIHQVDIPYLIPYILVRTSQNNFIF